jgi:ELWxxDGT repeat protein
MLRQIVLFQGTDTTGNTGLWETNGTAAGTHELTGINGAYTGAGGLAPFDFTVFNGEVLFDGVDASGDRALWVTNGTAAGTYELTGIMYTGPNGLVPVGFAVFNGEVLFEGQNTSGNAGLWETNGTAAGTHELTGIDGAYTGVPGLSPLDFTVFNSEMLFDGIDASSKYSLWVTNGTAAGTDELNVSGTYTGTFGFFPLDLTVFNGEVLFSGVDASGNRGLWLSYGTASSTRELIGISGAYSSGVFANGALGPFLTVFNGEVLFAGEDASDDYGLWETNGTAAGTSELTGIAGAAPFGLFFAAQPVEPNFTVFNGEVLFEGNDVSGHLGLWVTNGTAAGTDELTGISGAYTGGAGLSPSGFTVFNGEVLFEGEDTSGYVGLWVTNGTAAGTKEIGGTSNSGIHGANSSSFSPGSFAAATLTVPPLNNFNSNNTSDILFRNTSTGDTWFEAISNGAPSNPNPWNQIGGSDTHYSVAGTGDFYGTGTTDILYRSNSSGDTWIEAMSNGAFASWNQIGGSNTTYRVAGVGDFYGTGTQDILYRNISTGDTWFEQMGTNNDPFAGWHQISGSDTHFAVVGLGDFFGYGADDIVFRNNSTGDTWLEAISNGAFAGWSEIGGSDTHYSVVGVGDFFGNGTNDILFRNNSTGDTWFEAVSNGASAGWHQIGGSDTTYSVVGIGDYFGTNTSDILFRNASTGDTWFEAISNGGFASWHQIGGSNTSYSVPVAVGPPALT